MTSTIWWNRTVGEFVQETGSAEPTVRINLSALRNADLRAQYERQMSAMLQEAEALKALALRTVHSRIAGHDKHRPSA